MIKLVKFKDGSHGIRKGFLRYSFWYFSKNSDDGFFVDEMKSDCRTDLLRAMYAYNLLTDIGKVIR
jgi:hypothetical protein